LRELQKRFTKMLQSEGALAIINTRGTFNVTSGSGAQYKVGDPEPTPEITLPLEDGGRMARLLKRGEKVEMELDLKNVFTDNQKINNVIAEIPGTDPKLKNEIVLIGGHLDSWHGGTGGADNSSGCVVMMEAMRIIKALGVSPRRTIRIALWGGEEQGLYGSRGYLQNYLYNQKENKKLAGYDNFALYLNMDNGSGRFRGIYLEQNDLAVPYFKTWSSAIESLGFKTLSPRTTGSTDHVTFDRVGLPAFQFIQDELEYDRTYHTNMDTFERLSLDDLKIDAAMVAWLALSAANDNGRVPVKPGYPKPLPASPF
ncbi:MAG: M20/M25/M40 family metallo-hydrolase, partial [Bacteroidaceae bacterium]|nr:M20/M25/M40 family metallo-hydrolase [Bacteroidaceae bacterium]